MVTTIYEIDDNGDARLVLKSNGITVATQTYTNGRVSNAAATPITTSRDDLAKALQEMHRFYSDFAARNEVAPPTNFKIEMERIGNVLTSEFTLGEPGGAGTLEQKLSLDFANSTFTIISRSAFDITVGSYLAWQAMMSWLSSLLHNNPLPRS